MALETGTYISDLVSTNPAASDNISQGDDHIRLIKAAIKATFPNISGAVTPTHGELSTLGSTGTPTFGSMVLSSTDAGASAAPYIDLWRNSASPAANDALGQITFSGEDSAGNWTKYAEVIAVLVDPTNGSEDGSLVFNTTRAGTSTEALRISNQGYVGINAAAPEYYLDVTAADNVTTTTAVSIQNSSRNYGLGLGAYQLTNRNIGGTATTVDYTFDIGGASIFKTADTERMRISSNGNVGVGTSSSSLAKFAVQNDRAVNGYGAVLRTYNGATYENDFVLGFDGTSSFLGNYQNYPLTFLTNTTERMRIAANGNVGIGTTASDQKLNISGSIYMVGGDQTALTWTSSIGTHYVKFDSAVNGLKLNGYDNVVIETGSGTERMRVTNGGNVGIGTNNPADKLHVVGNIATTSTGSILVKGSGLVGYGTGAGSTVTQGTSRTTAVTLNKASGRITLVSAAATTSWTTFTVNNSLVGNSDTIVINQRTGARQYNAFVSAVSAGSFDITFAAVSGTTVEQPSFSFNVISGTAT